MQSTLASILIVAAAVLISYFAAGGTATIVDQAGNVLLHQQIGQEHISCELDDFDNQDYLDMMAQFEGTKGFIRWDGELDSYQNYYIVGQDGWTCIVTIPAL